MYSIVCMLDWLVDRRHCSLKWRQQLTPVREKFITALNQVPGDIRDKVEVARKDGTFVHSWITCM